MIAHPLDKAKLPNTAAVLQLNCRRSHHVTYSLFNDPHSFNFLFIALHEPPVNSHTNLPAEQKGWYLICHQPLLLTEDHRPRACIYVNTSRNPAIQPIHSKSRDLAACTVKLQGLEVLLMNAYNQPRMFLGFEAMELMLRQLPNPILLLPTIVVTDSNLHSPIWNPESYAHHEAALPRRTNDEVGPIPAITQRGSDLRG